MEGARTLGAAPPARSVIRRSALYLALACGISWAFWIPIILSQHGLIGVRLEPHPWGSFGPAAAAVLAAWRMAGWRRVRALLAPLARWRMGWRWAAVAVFLVPVTFAVAIAIYALAGGPLPAPAGLDRWYLVFPLAGAILVLGGPLGEEIGWRGHWLPLLQERYSPAAASLVVAAGWFVWHVPLFWMEGAAQAGGSLLLFGSTVLGQSVLFTWLYNASRGGLATVLVYHTLVNTTSVAVAHTLPPLGQSRGFDAILTAVTVVVALGVLLATRGRLGLPARR